MHMYKCTRVRAPSLDHSLSPFHLPTISIVLADRGHFCISGQLRQIQKDIRAPRHSTMYNNEIKRTMKDNYERWLGENRLSLRQLGKGLLLEG